MCSFDMQLKYSHTIVSGSSDTSVSSDDSGREGSDESPITTQDLLKAVSEDLPPFEGPLIAILFGLYHDIKLFHSNTTYVLSNHSCIYM